MQFPRFIFVSLQLLSIIHCFTNIFLFSFLVDYCLIENKLRKFNGWLSLIARLLNMTNDSQVY